MAALRECMKFAARLSDADADDLVARVDAYIASGIAPEQAQRAATSDILAEIGRERGEIVGLAEAKVPAADEPAAEPAVAEDAPTLSQPEPQAAPGFYSAMRRTISDAKTNASPAEYWSNLIKGKVTPEDLQASGFSAWLAGQDGKIKKADALAWIAGVDPEGAIEAPADSDPALSQRDDAPVNLPDAIIGAPLAAASSHPGYADAKAGDLDAAMQVAQSLITQGLVRQVRAMAGDGPMILQPVLAVEATGRNKLPLAGAALLAEQLDGARVGTAITQANRPQRTALDGLSRLFATPVFAGEIEAGARYVLFDDTLTQGGTFAGLAAHIRAGGGQVVGTVALTGKQYSATLALSPETLQNVRSKFAAVEGSFRAAAGHGFADLTESEGRFLATAKPADAIRDRIVAAGNAAGPGAPTGDDPLSLSQPSLSPPGQTWTGPGLSKLDDFIYNVQNKTVDLKRVVEAIKGTGSTLNDRQDAELRETLYAGRVSARIQKFEEGDLLPLLQEMRLANVSLDDMGQYLHARHAAERNAEMAARNRNRLNNAALSGMSDADAAAILAGARPVMATLAARVDAMITGTRNLMEVSGIEAADTVDALRQSYQHYVPLHREESDSDHSAHPIGSGFSVKGSVPKKALGSDKPVAHRDILSHIISEREQVIIRAEKNLISMAVYAMALQNQNTDFWTTDTPPQKGFIDERANIYVPGQGMMPNPNQGQVVYRTDPMYKSLENVLVVKVNGQDRTVQFNKDDPRAKRLAEALKNLDVVQLGPLRSKLAKMTRFLAAVNTQYNPVFSVKNFIRDLGGGLINLSSTKIAGSQAAVAAGIGPAMRAIYRTERGKAAVNQQWASLYDEFRLRGAKTGYRDVFQNETERTKDLLKKADRLAGGMAPLQQTLDLLSDANDAIENAIRLAAYKVALDKGMTKDQAASLAKNLTVNFNRKGAKTAEFNTAYMFFNAAIQGSARLAETMRGPAAAKIIGGGLTLGVLQALAMLSMDDDDREAVPEFVKRTSLVIPLDLFGQANKGKYVAIPLPLGLHAIPNTGRSLMELVLRRNAGDKADIPTSIAATFGAALDAFNPLGGASFMQQLAPSLLDPVVQLGTNEGWAGGPVYREREMGTEGMPGYLMGRDSTSPVYKGLAKVIHLIGNDFNPDVRNTDRLSALSPQPEALRLIPETIFGGVWRETEKLLDTALGMTKDVPLDKGRVPLLSAFYGDAAADLAAQGTFWRSVNKIEARRLEKRTAKLNGRDVAESWIDEVGTARVAVVRKQIVRLTAERRELAIEGGRDAEIREIERKMGEVMREFNAEVRVAMRAG